MTYREMLELAAKAAGYTLDGDTSAYEFTLGGIEWNPITDDGDALRLAVKLQLNIYCCAVRPSVDGIDHYEEPANGDPYAATRRAITRAAAEIGRSMK